MTETTRVIEASEQPVRDNDGLHRRRGFWHFKVKMANGRWQSFTTGTANFNEARRVRQAKTKELADGRLPTERSKWPLAKAAEEWLAGRAHDLAPSSQRRYAELVRSLRANFPARKLGEITAADIGAYQVQRLKLVSARSVNLEVRALSMILKRAKLWSRIADDFKPLREPKEGPGRALTPEQEAALFRTAASRPAWKTAYLTAMVAANTAARGGEIKGLRLGDVDLIERVMRIRRAKTAAGCRVVPLNDAATWALGRLKARAEALGASAPEHCLLPLALYRHTKDVAPCAGSGYDPTRPMQCWRSAWRSLTDAAGLPGLRFHDLRHHAITKLCESGAPDFTLMAMVGHVSKNMLEHYSHSRMEAKRTAVAAINTGVPASADQQATSAIQ